MVEDASELFVRRVKLTGIGPAPVARHIEADAGERERLAALFSLPAIAALAGDFTLTHEQAGVVGATLRLRAKVAQICVVSLEPFEAKISETAQLRFIPAARVREGDDPLTIDPETLEGPDEIFYTGDTIDLGAVLAEQLALALDPYPRKPGAVLPEAADDPAAHPFAALGNLRRRT